MMTTWQVLTTAWAWEPTVPLGCVAALLWYILAARPLTARAIAFAAGVLLLLLALISPLDTLGDTYLFSAHMLQHLLLVLAVPPLLLLGLPPYVVAHVLHYRAADRCERVLGRPLVAWLVGMATLWIWHLPALYEAALRNGGIHVVQHLAFLTSATVFWWPVLAPLAGRRRLAPLATVGYLVAATFANGVLGVVLTFAPPGLYPAYARPIDTLGMLALVRQRWGLSYALDQQLGGLLMWVVGGPAYLLAALGALARWYNQPEEEDAVASLQSLQSHQSQP